MNINDIKKICPDFVPYEDSETGNVQCKFFEDGMCRTPNHFVCDYLTYMENQERTKEEPEKIQGQIKFNANVQSEASRATTETTTVTTINKVRKIPEGKGDQLPGWATDAENKIEGKGDEDNKKADDKEIEKVYTAKQDRDFEFIFSHSRISLFESCPFKYKLKYIEKVEPEITQKWKTVGRSYHQAIEHYLKTGTTDDLIFESTGDPYEDAKIIGVMEGIGHNIKRAENPDDTEVEQKVVTEIDGYKVQMYIDGYDKAAKAIIEHKTRADITSFSLLSVIYQLSFYVKGRPETEQYRVNLIGKPKLRPKKGESVGGFKDRVYGDVKKNPQKYFREITYHRSEFDVEKYQNEIAHKIKEIMRCHEDDMFVRRPGSCAMQECEYRKVCMSKL